MKLGLTISYKFSYVNNYAGPEKPRRQVGLFWNDVRDKGLEPLTFSV